MDFLSSIEEELNDFKFRSLLNDGKQISSDDGNASDRNDLGIVDDLVESLNHYDISSGSEVIGVVLYRSIVVECNFDIRELFTFPDVNCSQSIRSWFEHSKMYVFSLTQSKQADFISVPISSSLISSVLNEDSLIESKIEFENALHFLCEEFLSQRLDYFGIFPSESDFRSFPYCLFRWEKNEMYCIVNGASFSLLRRLKNMSIEFSLFEISPTERGTISLNDKLMEGFSFVIKGKYSILILVNLILDSLFSLERKVVLADFPSLFAPEEFPGSCISYPRLVSVHKNRLDDNIQEIQESSGVCCVFSTYTFFGFFTVRSLQSLVLALSQLSRSTVYFNPSSLRSKLTSSDVISHITRSTNSGSSGSSGSSNASSSNNNNNNAIAFDDSFVRAKKRPRFQSPFTTSFVSVSSVIDILEKVDPIESSKSGLKNVNSDVMDKDSPTSKTLYVASDEWILERRNQSSSPYFIISVGKSFPVNDIHRLNWQKMVYLAAASKIFSKSISSTHESGTVISELRWSKADFPHTKFGKIEGYVAPARLPKIQIIADDSQWNDTHDDNNLFS